MSVPEYVIFCFIAEQRFHTTDLRAQFNTVFQPAQQGREIQFRAVRFIGNRRAICRKQMRIFGDNCCFVRQLECFNEPLAQLGKEMQRAAQKSNMPPNGLAARQPRDGLVDNCLKNRSRQILFFRALIDKRLNVRFREYTAARSNRVNDLAALCQLIQTGCICLQKACHLVDKGACAASADPVHALFYVPAGKVDDFCVLAAQLNGNVCFWRGRFHSVRRCNNLLNKFHANGIRQRNAAAACNHSGKADISQLFLRLFQNIIDRFFNFGKMPPVSAENNPVFRVRQHHLYCCRTNINTHAVYISLAFKILHLQHPRLQTLPEPRAQQSPPRPVSVFSCIFLHRRCRRPAPSAQVFRPASPESL